MADIKKYIPEELVIVRGGTWSKEEYLYGNLRQVFVIPPSEDTNFTFEIIDDDGFTIYRKVSLGSLSDNDLKIILFPEAKTFRIGSARYDGIYKVKLIYEAGL
jgi:hypothetical protein